MIGLADGADDDAFRKAAALLPPGPTQTMPSFVMDRGDGCSSGCMILVAATPPAVKPGIAGTDWVRR